MVFQLHIRHKRLKMKKLILLFVIFIQIGSLATAQHIANFVSPYPIQQPAVRPFHGDKSGGSIWVNYFETDRSVYGSSSFFQVIVPVHSNTVTTGDSTFSVSYLVTAFDTLTDTSLTYPFSYTELSNVFLDSIRIQFGHENNSGISDTVIVDIVRLDTVQHPTANIIWSDTVIFASGQSPANHWQNTLFLAFSPQLLLPEDTAAGVRVRYYGASQDTFGVVTGFGTDQQNCGTFVFPKASYSHFYPNSYGYWSYYNLLLPTQAGGDIYYDCNGNLEFDTITDGVNYIQNWDISALFSSPEIGLPGYPDAPQITVYPNPTTGFVYIANPETDHSPTTARLLSLDGRVLYSGQLNGNTLNLLTFAEGIYLLELQNQNWNVTKKLFIRR